MPGPFDATTKDLIRKHPEDWLHFLGLPFRSVRSEDTDLSTVSPDADKFLVVEDDFPYLLHLELQSSYKGNDPRRFLMYNVLGDYHIELLVRTIVILLRPEADGPAMHRGVTRQFLGEPPYLQFQFRVVRMWEQPVEAILQAGIGLLPLAPLCQVESDALPAVVHRMQERIEADAPDEAGFLWSSTYILLGLLYPPEFADHLLKGVRGMKESSTYQAIKAEGREEGEEIGLVKGKEIGKAEGKAEEAIAILLRQGTKRFGTPALATVNQLQSTTDLQRLEQLTDRILEVESWDELLA